MGTDRAPARSEGDAPAGVPQPADSECRDFVTRLKAEFDRRRRDPAPRRARRLNRAEYNNTVRDLFGVSIRPADDFPPDSSGYAFDDIGDVLSLSPVLMERYLTAAEKAVRAALFGPATVHPTMCTHRRPRAGGGGDSNSLF